MKRIRMGLFLSIVAAVTLFCVAQEKPKTMAKPQPATKHQHAAPAKANPEFERLKQLAGRWEGKSEDGKPVVSAYRVTAGGSAVMNMLFPGTAHEMLTVFHPDGANLMGTHYCSGHNQPRFVAEPSTDPKVLTFKFKDITNLAAADSEHIEGLVITFADADHHTEEWISRANGKVAKTTFELARVKK